MNPNPATPPIVPTHVAEDCWAHYRSNGWWEDTTRHSLFQSSVEATPDLVAIVDGDLSLTYAELSARAAAWSSTLRERWSIGEGDVVAYQLPNWWETAALLMACSQLGAIVNPLHLVYRQSDLEFVLGRTRPKAFFVPGEFGTTDYVSLAQAAVRGHPDPPAVVPIRGDYPPVAVSDEMNVGSAVIDSTRSAYEISLVLFTSGTTSRPKGALHSDNTLVRLVRDMCERYDLGDGDVIFIPSTMTHVSGLAFVWSALFNSGTAVLLDRWDSDTAIDLVVRTRSTFVGGATPFVRGLIDGARDRSLEPDEIPLTRGNCGSADVPVSLIREADEVLGAPFARGYGLTEGIIVSAGRPSDTLEHRGGTDGEVLPVNEVRVVDEELRPLPDRTPGEVLVRGPSNFLGYLDPADNAGAFADDNWVRTGDLAVLEDGYLTITGRIKDIVNRGGENIAVKPVEDELMQHSAVLQAAIVAMPDEVMGERCCAYVVLDPGATPPNLGELSEFLLARGVASQKLPERLEIRPEFPMTATGKVQKNELREEIRRILMTERTSTLGER